MAAAPDPAERARLREEVLNTERFFVESLKTFDNIYVRPLKNSGLVSDKDLTRLFGQLQVIAKVNSGLLREFEAPGALIGAAFLAVAPFLKTYAQYCAHYQLVANTIVNMKAENKKLKDFIDKLEYGAQVSGKMKIQSYLIMPVQRVPRYSLLFEELLKHTPPEEVEDVSTLTNALEQSIVVSRFLNQQIKSNDSREHILRIKGLLSKSSSRSLFCANLLQPYRLFVFEGSLSLTDVPGGYCFLFSDAIMYCVEEKPKFRSGTISRKQTPRISTSSSPTPRDYSDENSNSPVSPQNEKVYKYVGHMEFHESIVPLLRDIPADPNKTDEHAFQLIGHADMLTFFATDSESKREWMEKIESTLTSHSEKSKYMRSTSDDIIGELEKIQARSQHKMEAARWRGSMDETALKEQAKIAEEIVGQLDAEEAERQRLAQELFEREEALQRREAALVQKEEEHIREEEIRKQKEEDARVAYEEELRKRTEAELNIIQQRQEEEAVEIRRREEEIRKREEGIRLKEQEFVELQRRVEEDNLHRQREAEEVRELLSKARLEEAQLREEELRRREEDLKRKEEQIRIKEAESQELAEQLLHAERAKIKQSEEELEQIKRAQLARADLKQQHQDLAEKRRLQLLELRNKSAIPTPQFGIDIIHRAESVPPQQTPPRPVDVCSLNDTIQEQKAAKYSQNNEMAAQAWIETVTGQTFSASISFAENIKDGVVLCKLINGLRPGTIPKFSPPTKIAFKRIDNVSKFLDGCKALGLSPSQLFNSIDLVEEKDMGLVVTTLLCLKTLVERTA